MAHASRQVRKVRRLKRERSLLYKALKTVAGERDMFKQAAFEMAVKLAPKSKPEVEITRIPDEPEGPTTGTVAIIPAEVAVE